MTLTGRRFRVALGLAAAVATVSSCSRDEAEVSLSIAQTPSAYLFRSHGIAIGWILQFDLVLQERSGVGVRLERMEISALDRGTAQEFGHESFERVTLEQVGLTELAPRGRVTYPVQIGEVQIPPKGPIAIVIQILGTDAEGNAVTARLDGDYPLATPPPATPLP
jgi:hypothetical protein